MNLKKLLFALSAVTLVGSPVLSVVACGGSSEKPKPITTKVNISSLTSAQITPLENEILAEDWAAVKVTEINAMFNKSVLRALNGMEDVTDPMLNTDFTVKITDKAGIALTDGYNLTATDLNSRTFIVTVTSKTDSTKIEGSTSALPVLLPIQLAKTNFTTVTNPTITIDPTADYTTANGMPTNLTAVTLAQVTSLIKIKIQTAVAALGGGAATSDVDTDYSVTVKESTDAPGPYDFSTTGAPKTFNVILTAKSGSKKVIGATPSGSPIAIIFPVATA